MKPMRPTSPDPPARRAIRRRSGVPVKCAPADRWQWSHPANLAVLWMAAGHLIYFIGVFLCAQSPPGDLTNSVLKKLAITDLSLWLGLYALCAWSLVATWKRSDDNCRVALSLVAGGLLTQILFRYLIVCSPLPPFQGMCWAIEGSRGWATPLVTLLYTMAPAFGFWFGLLLFAIWTAVRG